ncbi:MAG: hypothetical protein IKJ33_00125 [Clostridia bacterium]|nr:hypothetical protein [Clostridia bacterium]
MKVYRLLGEDELEQMLNRNVENLGGHFARMNGNTHKYKPREKYIHFFFHKEDCDYVRKLQQKTSTNEQNFLVEFNIPLKKIIGHIGKGFYDSKKGGYDEYYDVCYELAIPVSIFNPSWLKAYERVSLTEEITAEQNKLVK